MATESKPDASRILAALQRGAIPPEIGPEWGALKLLLSRGWLVALLIFVIVFCLPLFVLGLLNFNRWGDIGVLVSNCLVIFVSGVLAIISAVVHFLRRRTVREDLSAGHVQQAEGEFLWHGSNYQPRFAGQRKWSTYLYHYGGVRPGAYRFYFLPRSGAVLLIEPLEGPDQSRAVIEAVRQALGFQMGDLDENRRGHMSPRQRRLVATHSLGRLLSALVLLAGIIATVVINWPKANASTPIGRALLPLLIIGIPMCAAVVYLCLHAYRLGRDAISGLSASRLASHSSIRLVPCGGCT
jgi:hypothetical protein